MPEQRDTWLTSPRPAALISVLLLMVFFSLALLDAWGWLPLDRLVNGPDPDVFYLPGLFINLAFLALPVAAGIIARGPIVRTLRAGGSLFAHPVHWIIVIFLVSAFAYGLVGLLIDQWPCFIGVPHCD